MTPILVLRTIEELRSALLLQRTTTGRVTQELDEVFRSVSTPGTYSDDEALAGALMMEEGALLHRYAAMPTLIEYRRSSSLSGVMDGGATFAVTGIIGEVLLANIRTLCSYFPQAHSTLLLVMLTEIDKENSEDKDLVDTFIKAMKIELQDTPEEKRAAVLRALVTPLAEAMIMVSEHYGLIASQSEEGCVITTLGRRVMLHLFAANKFVEAVSEAHVRLQEDLGPRN